MIRNVARRIYRELIPLLYGRTNFKLFLQRTFESLDRRVAATLCSTNVLPGIIRPIPIRAPFGRSMLVVAPHQDDEIIGCGGAMVLQRESGRQLFVVFTQDGGDEHTEDGRSREEQVAIREGEARRVAEDLGIPEPRFLRYAHLKGDDFEPLVADLTEELIRTRADIVFTPFLLDYNVQHQLTNYALAEALSRSGRSPKIMGYEVWGLCVPNTILNIDNAQDRKKRLLGLYASQLSGKDYSHGIEGLNMFHSMHFGAGECRFAERYFEMPAEDFVSVVREIRTSATPEGADHPVVF